MYRFTHKTTSQKPPFSRVVLSYEKRIKCRIRVTLENGQDAGIFLERGEILNDGDLLMSEENQIIAVVAANETLSSVTCNDALLFSRACYHLGNRHVPLQIKHDSLSYQHDHVLDEMLRGLGLTVETVSRPFEPEPGAYGGDSRKHNHEHGHHH